MGKVKRRGAALLLLLWVMEAAASPALQAREMLDSDPPGTQVSIGGGVSLSGVTPLPLEEIPPGRYRLRAQGPGAASVWGRLSRGDDGRLRLRGFAGPEAFLLPPGFIHAHRGDGWRGFLFLASGVSGLTGTLIKNSDVSSSEDDVSRAQQRYDQAVDQTAISDARLDLLAANDKLADDRDMRTLWAVYLGAAWIGAAVEAWGMTATAQLDASNPERPRIGLPRVGGWQAGWRSALVPGSGQRFLGHGGRGNRYAFGVMLGTAGAILAQEQFLDARRTQNDAQRRYDAAENELELAVWKDRLDQAADDTNDWNGIRWIVVGATAGVYLWNILDAVALGREASSPRGLSWRVLPEPDGFRASLTWRVS